MTHFTDIPVYNLPVTPGHEVAGVIHSLGSVGDEGFYYCLFVNCLIPINGRVDGAFATETINAGSIPNRAKSKTT